MENSVDNDTSLQTIALLKILELGQAQIENGQLKTMDEVFEELE
jgi:hypothetical protein